MTRMKDSGNPWVREIPSDWFEKKLRYLVKLRGEKSVTTDYKKYVGLENIMSQTGQYVQTGIEVDLTENLTFEVGDILFGKLRPYLRKYWRAEFSGTASSEFVIIKGSSLNLNFLFWAIQSDSFINDVDSSTYGSKMPRASWEYMKNIKLPFPESIEEQTQIADFLDKKVAQLDKVKSLLEEQINTLEDYRQSLIYETVTKGLDKTVPLKDSGVDWIGQIPEGWGTGKIKYYAEISAGSTPDRTNELFWNGDIPWMASGEVNQGVVTHTAEKITKLGLRNTSTKLLSKGTVMLALNGQGKTKGTAAILNIETASNQSLASFDVNNEVVNGYYLYYYFVSSYSNIRGLKGEDRDGLNLKLVSNIEIPLPNIDEQLKIADFLDKKTEQINHMIAIKKEQIENINKQRQTLIYDYVTGKRRV
ncbi:TPA: restriction endonuclease subunit S [Streptococcus suis]